MLNQDLDVNLVVQSFQEKINQLITENIIKEATIKQLTLLIEQSSSEKKVDEQKKDK